MAMSFVCAFASEALTMLLVLMSSDVSSSRLESSPSPPVTCVDILVHGLTDNALYGNKVSKLQVRVHTLRYQDVYVMIGMRWEGLNSTIPFQRQSLASNVFAAEIPQEVRSSTTSSTWSFLVAGILLWGKL